MSNNTPPSSPGDLAVKRGFSSPPSSGTVPLRAPNTPQSISKGSEEQSRNATPQLDMNVNSESRSSSRSEGHDFEEPNALSMHLVDVMNHSLSPQDQQLLSSLNAYMQQDGRNAINNGNLENAPDDDAQSDLPSDDSWAAPGSDAEQDGSGGQTNTKNKKKRKNQGNPTGPRTKTAREWHKRKNSKIPPEKRRGEAYKRQQLENLRKHKLNTVQNKPRKSASVPKIKSKNFADPSVFLGGGVHSSGPTSAEPDHGEMPDIDADRKKDFFNKFAEKLSQSPDFDIHKCKTHYNGLEKKSRSFGYNRMHKAGNAWHLVGMASDLLNHQMLGTAWMIERECSLEAPYGGICADDMGAGKTVQSLALIVGNPAEAKDKVKATLVIVPPSLQNQWWKEIKRHAPDLAENGMIFDRKRPDNSQQKLERSEIVLTNYSELIKSLPQPDPQTIRKWREDELDIAFETLEWTKENLKYGGLLHTIKWYRIVIDEAHHFKSPDTRRSRAMSFLSCRHPWLLSGTPIMNRYGEFHPLLCFIKEKISSSLTYAEFQTKFCDTKDDFCIQGLGIIVSDLIIRRSMKDKLMGHFIIPLPGLSKEVREVKRYKPERILYREFKKGLIALICQEFKKDDERKKLNTFLPQLTRMRQLIAHPDLIGRQIMIVLDELGIADVQKELLVTKLVRKSKPLARILQDRLSGWLLDLESGAYKASGLDEEDQKTCMVCNLPDEDLVYITKCKHTFCEMCLVTQGREEMEEDNDDLIEVSECPTCRKPYRKQTQVKPYHKVAPEPKGASKIKISLRKGKDARGFRPGLTANQAWALNWLHRFDKNEETEMLPSAKLRGVMDQIKDWIAEAPNEKIVVFTQFRLFAILVGIMLEKRNMGFIYFTGDMTLKQRDDALDKIENDPNIKVMIAGLKCGGQGLNFQFANRGIITDIWWNTCIDDQALGRFYRMGQKNPVHFVRIVVTKTVDSKIINLQEDKRQAICKVMQDKVSYEKKLAEILEWHEDDPDEEDDTSDEEGGECYDCDDEDGF